jgi:hypothetical protein
LTFRLLAYLFFIAWLVALCYVSVATAEQVRIGVIDSGYTYSGMANPVFCKYGSLDLTTGKKEVGSDSSIHGSVVVDIIADFLHKNDVDYCIVLVKLDVRQEEQFYSAIKGLKAAKVSYVNLTSVSEEWSFLDRAAMSSLPEATFFVAAGNDQMNLNEFCNSFPSCYKLPNVHVVGALDKYFRRAFYSNYGAVVDMWFLGDFFHPIHRRLIQGTSFAAPRALARYVKEKHEKKN